jgi:hypothetical protein
MNTIEPGIYVHYKSEDMKYEVIGTGMNTETHEEYVIYRPLYKGDINPQFWVRPYEMFIGIVEINGVTKPRFQKIAEI